MNLPVTARRAQLETLADALREAGVETVLLESQTQPGLFLLVCRHRRRVYGRCA